MARIDDLLNDPDFLNLPEPDQNEIIDALRQQNFGKVQNFENFLENAIRGSVSEVGPSFVSGGPSLTGLTVGSGTKGIEEGLPSALQIAGNTLGGEIGLLIAGRPFSGATIGGTIGRSIGEAGRQGVKSVFRGKKYDPQEVLTQTGLGLGTELASAPFSFLTSKVLGGPAGKEFRKKTGQALGSIKDIIKTGLYRPNTITSDEVVKPLRDLVGDLRSHFEVDPTISSHIESIANELGSKGVLDPTDLINAERNVDLKLKSMGVYGKKTPVNYDEAGFLIKVRELLNNKVTEFAQKAGVSKQFQKAKNVYSKVAKNYPKESTKHGLLKTITEARGIGGLIRGDIPTAVGSTLASEAIGAHPVSSGIYNFLKLGKAAPAGLSEFINFIRRA